MGPSQHGIVHTGSFKGYISLVFQFGTTLVLTQFFRETTADLVEFVLYMTQTGSVLYICLHSLFSVSSCCNTTESESDRVLLINAGDIEPDQASEQQVNKLGI